MSASSRQDEIKERQNSMWLSLAVGLLGFTSMIVVISVYLPYEFGVLSSFGLNDHFHDNLLVAITFILFACSAIAMTAGSNSFNYNRRKLKFLRGCVKS
jgi:hypothetical protein